MKLKVLVLAAAVMSLPIGLTGPMGAVASDTGEPVVTVYKSPTCGCCGAWGDHMRENGFTVVEKNTSDLWRIKALAGVPEDLSSCHTATVDGYVIEGHVPAGDVRRLLEEKPTAGGLAAPGMPASSPGMDVPGDTSPYDTILFGGAGGTSVYARH